MPFIKHLVQPIKVSQCQIPSEERNELECLSNLTLANIIRQLSSLGEHANDIFNELSKDAQGIATRAQNLSLRLQILKTKCTQLDSCTQNDTHLLTLNKNSFNTIKNHFKSKIKLEQLLCRSTMPESMRKLYDEAEAPPALDRLNEFRSDSHDSLKFYTDPDFFFKLWRDEMMLERKAKVKTNKKIVKHIQQDAITYQQQQQQQQQVQKAQYQIKEELIYQSNKNLLFSPSSTNNLELQKKSFFIDDRISIASSMNGGGSPLHVSSNNRPQMPPPPVPNQQQMKIIETTTHTTHSQNINHTLPPPPPSPPPPQQQTHSFYQHNSHRSTSPPLPPPLLEDDQFELPLPPPPPELINDLHLDNHHNISTVIIKSVSTTLTSHIPPAPPLPPPPIPIAPAINQDELKLSSRNETTKSNKASPIVDVRQNVLDDIKRGQYTLRTIKENEHKEKEQAVPTASTVNDILDFINKYRRHVHNSSDEDEDENEDVWDKDD